MASYRKISELLDSNPSILRLLVNSDSLSQARSDLFNYLNECDAAMRKIDCPLHPLEIKNTMDCIEVFKNIISPSSEQKTRHSCLDTLWKLSTEHWRKEDWPDISDAFLVDMQHLFKGVIGLSGIYSKSGICKREIPAFIGLQGRDAALVRSNLLNETADQYKTIVKKNCYQTGLDSHVVQRRQKNKKRILDYLAGTQKDWSDYRWHLKNVIRTADQLTKLIEATDDEVACIKEATEHSIPFSITPFYLSLFEKSPTSKYDRSLRSHVIPNRAYIESILGTEEDNQKPSDFMRELDTSPVELITRRYPLIAIFKPYKSCPQICCYCQRNWELMGSKSTRRPSSTKKMDAALSWFKNNPLVEEVLITGGDPLMLNNSRIEEVIRAFCEMPQIKRVRIGTRCLVTIPMRFDDGLITILDKYHDPPRKVISIVTHVQHSYEISIEMENAVKRLKGIGLDIFNQQVFTIQNCRRFETCYLRENLRKIGIIPYYLFNLKDKRETAYFKVPVARLLQEQKEEARLMPGLVRTDKPVFNIPGLGKNYLDSWQDHELIMIIDDGSRVYEFYPWEKYMAPVNTFLYRDTPIYDFLKRLESLGENPHDYETIWYYF